MIIYDFMKFWVLFWVNYFVGVIWIKNKFMKEKNRNEILKMR
jgi:hypothetical protein